MYSAETDTCLYSLARIITRGEVKSWMGKLMQLETPAGRADGKKQKPSRDDGPTTTGKLTFPQP